MEKSATKDMTQGTPIKLILSFFIPLLLGMLFQQFYSMMDTIIVGKFLGVNALAAVGSTGSINFMIIGFCMGVCSGFAKDYHYLRKYTANSAWLAGIFALVMTVVVCLLCDNILRWMGTPSDIIKDAYAYIFVIFLGIPFTWRQQKPACIFDHFILIKYRTGSDVYPIVPYGRIRRGMGDRHFPGDIRRAVLYLYEEKI